jgi:2-polyprenyl-6-methoxyphenol hydroxylase-like FAD-dependent oxidoreductase
VTVATSGEPDVIVVGGGIGGLSAAFALTRKGLRVRVLERAREFGEVGAGIQIAPNCTRILNTYGLLAEAKRLGVLPGHMVMKDAADGTVLTSLDLRDMERRYGTPYMVIHRSDLHGLFLRACQDAGVDLRTSQTVTEYETVLSESTGPSESTGASESTGPSGSTSPVGARVRLADGGTQQARLVIAADGLHSVARGQLVGDEPVNSAYVAYRGAVPIEKVRENNVSETDVVVYIGPRCHFVQYPLRGGEMFNQVAVFESPKARAGEADWGTPDELDSAFAGMTENIQLGLPLMGRDRCWRMFDRDPIMTWVYGRVALLGDAAHPPLQYIAQGAIMAIEDGYVLAEHLAANPADIDGALAAYQAVRTEHCRRVLLTSRAWGELWHLDGEKRARRNEILRARDPRDYTFVDWLYSVTARMPSEEPEMFEVIPLDRPAPAARGFGGSANSPSPSTTVKASARLRTPSLRNRPVWMFSTVLGDIPSDRAVCRIECPRATD